MALAADLGDTLGALDDPGSCALMWSGGKDSYLALTRARRQGLNVTTLVNFYEQPTGRVRFHAIRHDVVAAQAFSLGVRLRQHPVPADRYESIFETALRQLAEVGHRGVVFGNIHLTDVREWFETRVRAAGLEHIEPLWHQPPAALLDEFIDGGGQAIVTCVESARLPTAWLGRAVDEGLAADLARRPDVDPCGERGEYHTFVYAGLLIARPVLWRPGPIHEEAEFAMLEVWGR